MKCFSPMLMLSFAYFTYKGVLGHSDSTSLVSSSHALALKLVLEMLIKSDDNLVTKVESLESQLDKLKPDSQNVNGLLIQLSEALNKFSNLEKLQDDTVELLNEARREISDLKQNLSVSQRNFVKLLNEANTEISKLNQQHDTSLKLLDKAYSEISVLKQQLNENKTNSETKLAALEHILEVQNSTIYQGLQSEAIAFSAEVSSPYEDLEPGETIKFASVVTNIGNAYNSTSGEFTAPVAGLYMFYVHLLTGHERHLEAGLLVKGVHPLNIGVYCGTTPYHGSGNNLIVVHLEAGATVRVAKNASYGKRPFYIHGHWSTFSGFLIKADPL